MTRKQRTTDWFLGRMFRFSSTTFHVPINLVKAVYIDEQHMKECHQLCKDIVQLDPRNSITINNTMSLEDDDVPHQRSDLVINHDVDSNNTH
jgi:hypothetical protein